MAQVYIDTKGNLKVCADCGLRKPASDFHKNRRNKDGLQTYCRECRSRQASVRYYSTPAAQRYQPKRVWVTCKECGKEYLKIARSMAVWDGACCECGRKNRTLSPEELARRSSRARELTRQQGGVPNAKKFKPGDTNGEKNHRWRGGITPQNTKERNTVEAVQWRKAVFARDGFTCQLCGQVGGRLNAHHKKAWKSHPDLRFDLDNGVTLCTSCHKGKAHGGSYRNHVEWEDVVRAS